MTRSSHRCFTLEPIALLGTGSSAMRWEDTVANGRQAKPVYGQPSSEVQS